LWVKIGKNLTVHKHFVKEKCLFCKKKRYLFFAILGDIYRHPLGKLGAGSEAKPKAACQGTSFLVSSAILRPLRSHCCLTLLSGLSMDTGP